MDDITESTIQTTDDTVCSKCELKRNAKKASKVLKQGLLLLIFY